MSYEYFYWICFFFFYGRCAQEDYISPSWFNKCIWRCHLKYLDARRKGKYSDWLVLRFCDWLVKLCCDWLVLEFCDWLVILCFDKLCLFQAAESFSPEHTTGSSYRWSYNMTKHYFKHITFIFILLCLCTHTYWCMWTHLQWCSCNHQVFQIFQQTPLQVRLQLDEQLSVKTQASERLV